ASVTEGDRSIAGQGPRDSLARGNPRGAAADSIFATAPTMPPDAGLAEAFAHAPTTLDGPSLPEPAPRFNSAPTLLVPPGLSGLAPASPEPGSAQLALPADVPRGSDPGVHVPSDPRSGPYPAPNGGMPEAPAGPSGPSFQHGYPVLNAELSAQIAT